MDKKRHFSRLGSKLVGVSVLGLVLAFAVFYSVENVVMPWLLYSERFAAYWQGREGEAVQAYQDYVTEHGLTTRQVLEDKSGRMGEAVSGIYTIMVGEPLPLSTGSEWAGGITASAAGPSNAGYSFTWERTAETDVFHSASVEFVMAMHQIQCADGAIYVAATPAALRYEGLGRAAGLLLALLGFCLVVVPYILRLLRRIGVLSREAGVLMAGDLEHSIRVVGRDELSGLGEDIERLRCSVLERIQGEREAVAANSRLITSLSHDLRTPLTKLTGYLDILAYHKYQTQEEHDNFLRLASEKAAQIKMLTDQMFVNAQVDAVWAPLEQPPEVVDGGLLLGQLLEEQCGDLCREGFDARPPVFCWSFRLYLRTADAVRIFDNLFQNLRKYADPSLPIRIQVEDRQEKVILRVENRVRSLPDRTDSHGVGVPTMRELLGRAGGTLEVSMRADRYESVLTFPKC